MEKGYCSMAFEACSCRLQPRESSECSHGFFPPKDFKEEAVPVHPSVFPDLIGKGGVTIKAADARMGRMGKSGSTG